MRLFGSNAQPVCIMARSFCRRAAGLSLVFFALCQLFPAWQPKEAFASRATCGRRPVREARSKCFASNNPLRLPDKEQNPFDLFGVKRGTEKAEIRKIFRKRVQTEHPDVSSDPEAGERFQELVAAYNSIMGHSVGILRKTSRHSNGLNKLGFGRVGSW